MICDLCNCVGELSVEAAVWLVVVYRNNNTRCTKVSAPATQTSQQRGLKCGRCGSKYEEHCHPTAVAVGRVEGGCGTEQQSTVTVRH